MAIPSLREVMDALRDQIETAVNVGTVDVQVYARIPSNPTLPAIDIFPGDPASDPESAGFGDIQGGDVLTVRARVDSNDMEANQDLLIDFMDPFSSVSVAAAIVDDPDLGGLARLDITANTGMRPYLGNDGTTIAFGAEWTVSALRYES